MSKASPDSGEVNARIVYWGPAGSGKSTNLHAAFAKLRPDHRVGTCLISPKGLADGARVRVKEGS